MLLLLLLLKLVLLLLLLIIHKVRKHLFKGFQFVYLIKYKILIEVSKQVFVYFLSLF